MDSRQEVRNSANHKMFDLYKGASKLPLVWVERSVNEEPDAVCLFWGKCIGIEFTEYFHSDLLKQEQGLKEQLLHTARATFMEIMNEDIKLAVVFESHWSPTGQRGRTQDNFRRISVDLCRLLSRYVTSAPGVLGVDLSANDLCSFRLDQVFSSVYFDRRLSADKWTFDRCYWSRRALETECDLIVSRIENKTSRHSTYVARSALDECWLVVHSKSDEISDVRFDAAAIDVIADRIRDVPFEGVYFLDCFRSDAHKLK